jgi:hypothetical protein
MHMGQFLNTSRSEETVSNLQFSPLLNRMIRQDAPTQLGEPTRPFLETAVRDGHVEEANQWLDYYLHEQATIRYIFGVWDWYMVRYYLDRNDDWAQLLQESIAPWIGTTAGLKDQPAAQIKVEGRNALLTVPRLPWVFHLEEGDGRYDLTLDSPTSQEKRWNDWRSTLNGVVDRHDLDAFNRLLDDHLIEARLIHDIECDWAWALLTVIARTWGEDILGEVLRVTEEPWVTVRYEKLRDMAVEDSLRLTIEGMRGHFSGPNRAGTISVVEEEDRYVLSFDACGTGGRMRRGDPTVGRGSRLDVPYHFLNITEAHDWTWNRKGVCAYCAHCAVVNQILPIEGLGRPMRLTQYPENSGDPCRWIIYKDPQGFPDEAFTSVGKTRGGR